LVRHGMTRVKFSIPEGENGFVSSAGFLGIVVCLVVFGGLILLGRLIWPELAVPWLLLTAFVITCLVLLMIILLLPYERKRKH
jgi:hypothetical protein